MHIGKRLLVPVFLTSTYEVEQQLNNNIEHEQRATNYCGA